MSTTTPAIEAWIEQYQRNHPKVVREPKKSLADRVKEARRRGFKRVYVTVEQAATIAQIEHNETETE